VLQDDGLGPEGAKSIILIISARKTFKGFLFCGSDHAQFLVMLSLKLSSFHFSLRTPSTMEIRCVIAVDLNNLRRFFFFHLNLQALFRRSCLFAHFWRSYLFLFVKLGNSFFLFDKLGDLFALISRGRLFLRGGFRLNRHRLTRAIALVHDLKCL
jgi:hypothetical protein